MTALGTCRGTVATRAIPNCGADLKELAKSSLVAEFNDNTEVIGYAIKIGDCSVSPVTVAGSLGEISHHVPRLRVEKLRGWPGQNLVQGIGPVADSVGADKSVLKCVAVTVGVVADARGDTSYDDFCEVLEFEAEDAEIGDIALVAVERNPTINRVKQCRWCHQ